MLKLRMYYRWFANYLRARICCFGKRAFSPRVLSIETTEKCNLNCLMCPRKQTSLSETEFTLKQFERVLSIFPKINTVILLGRGETFMMKDIFAILELGSRRNIYFTIITNGMLLTDEKIKNLPRTGKVLFSIDHPHPDKYSQIRKGGDLNIVVSNMKMLKKMRPQQWTCIQAVVMKSNIDYLEDFIKLAKDVSADAVKLICPMIFDRAMSDIYVEASAEVSLKLDRAKAFARRLGIRFVAVPQMGKPRACVEPWFGLRVTLNGDIYPCCYIDNSNDSAWCEWYKEVALTVPQSNYVMGNIYANSVDKLWNGEAFGALRKKIIDTRQRTLLPPKKLNTLRGKLDVAQGFSYCAVCLYRQNKAC